MLILISTLGLFIAPPNLPLKSIVSETNPTVACNNSSLDYIVQTTMSVPPKICFTSSFNKLISASWVEVYFLITMENLEQADCTVCECTAVRPRMPEDPVIGRLPLYELNCIARQVTLSMSCAALHHCLSTALLFPTELHGIIVPPCSFTVQSQQL